MELRSPRKKKRSKFRPYEPLNKLKTKINAFFDGFSIVIEDLDDIKCIYERGFYGKANLSRSYPTFDKRDIIRQRQYTQRLKWKESSKIKKVIVVPDSDTDDENYFKNLKPEYKINKSDVKEKLHLSLVEGYYLSNVIECLRVSDDDNPEMSKNDMWKVFCSNDTQFVSNYIAYQHFRRKGWIVKPGLKYGGDYLLYKDGPPYYHASYVVIIDVVNEDLVRRKDKQCRSMEMVNVVGLNRLCENAGKELLLCQIIWPTSLSLCTDDDLSKIGVNEILVRRWTENQDD